MNNQEKEYMQKIHNLTSDNYKKFMRRYNSHHKKKTYGNWIKKRTVIKRIITTLVITFMYCMVWMALEYIFSGKIVNNLVDNIIMVLFIPIIYSSTKNLTNL